MTEDAPTDFVATGIPVQIELGGNVAQQVEVHSESRRLEDVLGDLIAEQFAEGTGTPAAQGIKVV